MGMDSANDYEKEINRLYYERANLILAYQEISEAARRLDEGFRETIKAHQLDYSTHRHAFKFHEETKKKCEELLRDIV